MNAPGARCGWCGKLPSGGDFFTRRVPAPFATRWEAWLLAVLAGSRAHLRERWQDSFLSAPAWRFVLGPGVVAQEPAAGGWAGVMVPSVDAVGRYYPLTLVCALAGTQFDPEQTVKAMGNWFGMAEMLATEALSPRVDVGAFDDSVAALPMPSAPVLPAPGSRPSSAWLSETSEVAAAMSFTTPDLPSVGQYCFMLTGKHTTIAAAS